MFIQYASHEARGPLQVVDMGLELHISDLDRMKQEVHRWSELEFTEWKKYSRLHVQEVIDACTLTKTTLTDLLTYENIETGMVLVDTEATNLFSFVVDTVRLFVIQVRI